MKILLVITKGEIGGAQEFVLSLASGLQEKGISVAVASGKGDYLAKQLARVNIKYYYLKNLSRSINPLSALFYIIKLRRLIKREKFTHVHFNSTNALLGVLGTKLLGHKVKTIFTVHGLSILDRNYESSKFKKSLFKVYFKLLLSLVNKVVFVSKHNKGESIKQGISKKGRIIYYGLRIEENYFLEKEEARDKLSKLVSTDLGQVFLLGSVGRLAYQKNYEFLINLWPEIKKIQNSAKLVILGEGPERSKYEDLIKKMNLEQDIFLPGELSKASKYLLAFDKFILPSRYEGLPISLLEVLFANIPVLASDVGGNREIIGEENCFRLNDRQDFLDKFKRGFLRNNNKNNFYLEKMVEEYLEVYG